MVRPQFYDPKISMLLEGVKHLTVTSVLSHGSTDRYVGGGVDLFEMVRREIGMKLAREFANKVTTDGEFEQHDDPSGLVLSLTAYCFTRETLLHLVADAFNAGRADMRSHSVPAFPSGARL